MPPETPEKALENLFRSLFGTADPLRNWLDGLPDYAEVVYALPSGPIDPAQFFHDAVRKLKQRGMVDRDLFAALGETFLKRASDVAEVAARWGVVVDIHLRRQEPEIPPPPPKPPPPPRPDRPIPWLQVEIRGEASGPLRVRVTSDARGRVTADQSCDGLSRADALAFGARIAQRARAPAPLTTEDLREGRRLFGSLFAGDVGQILNLLRGEGDGQVLVQLVVSEPALRAVPWEALCGPTDLDVTLATHRALRVVRGVFTLEASRSRTQADALRLLTVADASMGTSVEDLQARLAMASGPRQIAWMKPAVGLAATWRYLHPLLLERETDPHVLHLICHGREGTTGPELLLDADQGVWTSVRDLANVLAERKNSSLRLVYLEACSGADPGPLASAAERLAAWGVEAAVAHLWPVREGTARNFANAFYRSLLGPAEGDLSAAMNQARQSLGETAEHLSPILFLRGHDPRLY